jgi:hypothetical protein
VSGVKSKAFTRESDDPADEVEARVSGAAAGEDQRGAGA